MKMVFCRHRVDENLLEASSNYHEHQWLTSVELKRTNGPISIQGRQMDDDDADKSRNASHGQEEKDQRQKEHDIRKGRGAGLEMKGEDNKLIM